MTPRPSASELVSSTPPFHTCLPNSIYIHLHISPQTSTILVHLSLLLRLSKADTPLWRQTAESGVSLSMVALALQANMTAAGSLSSRLTAASVYCALLAAPGCPAASIWDEVGFQSLIRALRHASGVALSAIAAAKDANDDVSGIA